MNKEVLVYWDYETIKEGGFYENEQGQEIQELPLSTSKIEIKRVKNTDIEAEFKEQDGDFDYNKSIRMVTDLKGLVLFDLHKENLNTEQAISSIKYGLWAKGGEQ